MKRSVKWLAIGLAALPVLGTASARAAQTVIDFETLPGGSVGNDNDRITTQYASLGATFRARHTDGPRLAQVGGAATAFIGFQGLADTPAPGQNTGAFFLTDDGTLTNKPKPLIVDFIRPMTDITGQILDINRHEGWVIEARDVNKNVLESVKLNRRSPNVGTGIATTFSFSHNTPDISSLRLVYVGRTQKVGWALDNLTFQDKTVGQSSPSDPIAPPPPPPTDPTGPTNPTDPTGPTDPTNPSTPEPASIATLGLLAAGTLLRRRRA